MTPFFKIRDSHRDSHTILSYDATNQGSMFWNYEPQNKWFPTMLPSSVKVTHLRQIFLLSHSFSHTWSVWNWPKQPFGTHLRMEQSIELFPLVLQRETRLHMRFFAFLWFYILYFILSCFNLILYVFCRQLIISDEPKGETCKMKQPYSMLQTCCTSQSSFT